MIFGKKGQIELARRIHGLSMDTAECFINYLKDDPEIFDKCIKEDNVKLTSIVFMINLYREMLNTTYNDKSVYLVITTAVKSLTDDKKMKELFFQTMLDYMQICNNTVEYYKKLPDFNIIHALTKAYFGLIIADRSYLMEELENSIANSKSYKKIFDYLTVFAENKSILREGYKLKLR